MKNKTYIEPTLVIEVFSIDSVMASSLEGADFDVSELIGGNTGGLTS